MYKWCESADPTHRKISVMTELVKQCASHIWTDGICSLPCEKQKEVIRNSTTLTKVVRAFKQALEETFQEIRDGRHKCSSECFIEWLFGQTDPSSPQFKVDLETVLRLAQEMLSQVPKSFFDAKFDTLDDRKQQISHRLLQANVHAT